MKTCLHCKETKPLNEFGIDNHRHDKLNKYCKKCVCAKKQNRSEKYREKILAQRRALTANCKSLSLNRRFQMWQKNAKSRNKTWALTLQDLEAIPLICHYTGQPLTLDKDSWYTVSLDRLDSAKGYTRDNVVFCCAFINIMKSELSYEQFIVACKQIAHHHDTKNPVGSFTG